MTDIKDIHPQFRWVFRWLKEWKTTCTSGEWRIEWKNGGIVRMHRTETEHADKGVVDNESSS